MLPFLSRLLTLLVLTLPAINVFAQPQATNVVDIAPAWSGHSVGYCLLTKGARQYVAFYNHERQMVVTSRELSSATWQFKKLDQRVNWDSHHYITMAMDKSGRLHISGNMHGDPLVYYRMAEPHDIDSLQHVTSMVGRDETKCTYPQFISSAEGELHFLYRSGKSGDGVQLVNRYDVQSQSWSRLLDTPLFDGLGKVSCYPEGPVLGPDGYFHLIWVWRATGACETNHLLCYARSNDLIHWESAKGEAIALPMSPQSASTIIDPVPIEGGMINESTVVGFDGGGRAILSYHKFDAAGNTQIYNARFEEGAWKIYQTSEWDHRWFFSGGGTIEVDVDLGPVTPTADGTLLQGYKHVKYGNGVWVLDEESLKPAKNLPGGSQTLETHNVPVSSYPDIRVRWKADEIRRPSGSNRFFLRWEAPLVNRDAARETVAKPAMLRVYEVSQPELFDLELSCIHDGYF
jgi:hypothetical protein